MVLVGFNDEDRYYIAKNSWGNNWGLGGYCYITYDYAEQWINEYWIFDIPEFDQI